MKGGGFLLCIWCSNHTALLLFREAHLPLQWDGNNHVETLGLLRHLAQDQFQVVSGMDKLAKLTSAQIFTKRSVMTVVTSTFDPLGFISLIITAYKILLQQLWQARLSWDEGLSIELLQQWTYMYSKLLVVNHIHFYRLVVGKGTLSNVQLHSCSVVFKWAYSSFIYIRSTTEGRSTMKLLCCKSSIAPVKRVSLPCLELCGTLVLSWPFKEVFRTLSMNISKAFLWTDSSSVSFDSCSPNKVENIDWK